MRQAAALFILVCLAERVAASEEAAEIVRRHLARLDGLAALTLRVERQTTYRAKTTTERWTLHQKGAARFRIEYEFPLRRVLVANERELWEYVPQAKQAARTDLAAMAPEQRAAFLRGVLARVAVQGLRFDTGGPDAQLTLRGAEQAGGRTAYRIECQVQRDDGTRLVRGLIDAERLVLLRCEFVDAKGQVIATTEAERVFEAAPGLWLPRRVVFKRLGGHGLVQSATLQRADVNPELADDLFEFRVPDGVEVVAP